MTTLVAWLLHHSKDVPPIPGTSKLDHLEENVGGGTLVPKRRGDRCFGGRGGVPGSLRDAPRSRLTKREAGRIEAPRFAISDRSASVAVRVREACALLVQRGAPWRRALRSTRTRRLPAWIGPWTSRAAASPWPLPVRRSTTARPPSRDSGISAPPCSDRRHRAAVLRAIPHYVGPLSRACAPRRRT